MAKKEILKSNRRATLLTVQPQELNLMDLKELLKRSKPRKRKKDKKGKIIGYVIASLGIMAFISTLIINRLVDREYFPDSTIIFIMIVSLFTLLLGTIIMIKEI